MYDNNYIEVIGDVHGCINTLEKLYELIIKDCKSIYSVGDLVDRGNFSKEVIEFFIKNNIKPVRGNHEDMLMNAIDIPKMGFINGKAKFISMYFDMGGGITQKSYINSIYDTKFDIFKTKFKRLKHYDFIKSFPLAYEFDKVLITHAGIIKGGNESSILWNREPPGDIGKLQIIGHTPQSRIKVEKNYVNIDTGCVYGNALSAALVNTVTGEVVKTYSVETEEKDIF
jgi:serine/threonine protein phosphatase 1